MTEEAVVVSTRVLEAKRADYLWHLDLTVVPTAAGFWVPWRAFSKALRWPFCWWVAVVIDQFSRRVCGFALFKKKPSSKEVCRFLDRVMKRTGTKPSHIVTDRGRQFIAHTFKRWCHKRHVQVRYGAVGKHGSVAVIERFIQSMKAECTRRILVPFGLGSMREELALYVIWYNEHRPHQGLDGMTPDEVRCASR
jgi:putative transposase